MRVVLAIFYILLPFVLFCIGFLHWYIGLPATIFSIYCARKVLLLSQNRSAGLSWGQEFFLWLVALLWCIHTGIGGLWVQHYDFAIKNAVLRDLTNLSWPLYYDLSEQTDVVTHLIGNDQVAFVYYLFTYLPAAFFGWLFSSEWVGQISLLLWSTLGLYLVLRFILDFTSNIVANKLLIGLLLAVFCFSGLEVIGAPLLDLCLGNDVLGRLWANIQSLSIAKEMWCWPYFSMYGSLYSDMEIRFNQTIPIWVICSLILSTTRRSAVGFFFSFLLLYSPWACLGAGGMVLYVIGRECMKSGWLGIKQYLSLESVLFPVMLAILVGSYYMSNQNSASFSGWFWKYMSVREFFVRYVLFILIEIGCYFLFLRKRLPNNFWMQASFFILLLLPFYRITAANDLLMCASIPAIFVIAVHWFVWLKSNYQGSIVRKGSIILFMCLTALTPLEWAIAEDYHYLSGKNTKLKDMVYSFSTLNTENANLCDQQFFAHDYEESFFWKYLAKPVK